MRYFERSSPTSVGGSGEWLRKMRGHFRTIQPFLHRSLWPVSRPETQAWTTTLLDSAVGPVILTGRYLDGPDSDAVVVVHGLGGSSDSGYMALALAAAARSGRRCLLLNTRGSDRSGADISHAGLTDDLTAALKSPELASVQHIDLFGYSLGGHLAIKFAASSSEPRLRRVAAICSPLSLSASASAFDLAEFSPYRRHVMESLYQIHAAAYQRRPVGIRPEDARRIKRIREWDERVVAPRFGFESAEHYYSQVSATSVLDRLQTETLYVGATYDPMVPGHAAPLPARHPFLSVRWEETAGHLGFLPNFDLGFPAPLGLESQVLSWLER